jgi:small subunit ribosomal protein S9
MVKIYNVKALRKKAVARAVIKPGNGKIRINNQIVDVFGSKLKRELILEPTHIVPEEFSKYDFFVIVSGGGLSGQAQAIRSCIAKGIVLANGNKKSLKDKFINYNRYILVDDIKNKEPNKQLGRGARKKKQQSKR